GAEPKIERKSKDDLLVVTVPRTGKSAPERAVPPDSIPDPSLLPLTNWDREILDRMERMRREMDRLFADGLRNFGRDRKDVFDEARFGSAIDLQEEGDNYVVRAYLPDRNMDQVNVTLEGQTLKIEAREQQRRRKESDSGAVQSSRTSAYSQVFTLPGPVQEEKMKVDRKENMVVITLPKAK
ncbi:MAG TPA: Hsp20/alpha crystallin family protein, partial [Chthoniobacterales bacterium]|nr:Hsp20/alpha crystallin family protein [Chthoniobacterales bacterium]